LGRHHRQGPPQRRRGRAPLKWWTFALLLAFLAFLSPIAIKPVQASTNCHASGDWCVGWSQVSTKTGGVLGTDERCFSMRETNSAPSCSTTTSNEATFDLGLGGCITLFYFDTSNGATAPAAPNKVTLQIYPDNSVSVAAITYQVQTAEPSNGASFQFCGTNGGTSGSAARADTYRIYIRVIKDNGAGGNYDLTSDGNNFVGTSSSHDRGMLRSSMAISSITRSAYPAGSTFAYGTAADGLSS